MFYHNNVFCVESLFPYGSASEKVLGHSLDPGGFRSTGSRDHQWHGFGPKAASVWILKSLLPVSNVSRQKPFLLINCSYWSKGW